ncbi:hypothetical protein [Streptomyces sp. CB01373]|uniref:hypothetical protein n=1 Tax=Streptomyces sp. CB01373 TaxID=2020325 RepID=UPI00131B2A83|nr:hypothetical protein [Streptomyces sp. CB01373]
MALALEQLSDPASLMWLLCLLQKQGPQAQPVVDHCQDVLEALARGPLLTVRALARRLLTDAASVSMGASHPAGLTPAGRLWTSAAQGDSPRDPVVTGMGAEVAGARLNEAEQLQPGLIRAVLARVRREVDTEHTIERNKAQSRANLSADEGELPDAYLAIEETIEEAIQTVASGSRAHRLSQGLGLSDPAAWEDQLATVLTDGPRIPLAFEEARRPRPDLPLPPGPDDPASQDTPLIGTTAETISTRPLTQAAALTGQDPPGLAHPRFRGGTQVPVTAHPDDRPDRRELLRPGSDGLREPGQRRHPLLGRRHRGVDPTAGAAPRR